MLKDINRILIVKLSSIGDVVHSLPTLKALRDTYPHSYIAWVVEEKSKDVVIGNPYLDEVIIFEKERWKTELFKKKGYKESIKEILDFRKFLRQKNFDLAIDLQGLIRSGLIAYLSGARIRVGYQNSREMSSLFYNLKIPPRKVKIHAVDRYLDVACYLGAEIKEIDFPLFVSAEDKKFAEDFLREHNISEEDLLIGINPGASVPHKRWQKEKFAKLADILIENYGAEIIIFGSPKDEELTEEVINLMKYHPINASGKTTIKQLAALISNCKLFIGNDTGPLHIAVAMKTPVVAIFGPDDPSRTGPYGKENIIIYKGLPCSPCIRHPTCKDYPCMQQISVEEVLSAVERLIPHLNKVPIGM